MGILKHKVYKTQKTPMASTTLLKTKQPNKFIHVYHCSLPNHTSHITTLINQNPNNFFAQ